MSTLRGIAAFFFLLVNTLFWCALLFPLALLKLPPYRLWRRRCTRMLQRVAEGWIAGMNGLSRTLPTEWEIADAGILERRGSYLLLSNHQSWVDIPVLLFVFGGRIPFPVFFVKKELRRLPLVGQAMWALDFPFVERYPRQVLERRPELRGRDLETSRQACEHYLGAPVTMVNFPEGTRFTRRKHRRQGSPFRHLLAPRPGGAAVVLSTLGPQLKAILDVTIAYPDGRPGFWHYLCGRVPQVRVQVHRREIPADFSRREFRHDPEFRHRFRDWLESLWRQKDAELERVLRSSADSG